MPYRIYVNGSPRIDNLGKEAAIVLAEGEATKYRHVEVWHVDSRGSNHTKIKRWVNGKEVK